MNFLKKSKDDLANSFYLKFKILSSIFHNLSLHSVFAHFCYCKRTCDQKKANEFYCEFCSQIFRQIFDHRNAFEEIIIDKRDFPEGLNKFFEKDLLFPLDVCYNNALWINTPRVKLYKCTYCTFIRKRKKLHKWFLNVLIRLYLISFFFIK